MAAPSAPRRRNPGLFAEDPGLCSLPPSPTSVPIGQIPFHPGSGGYWVTAATSSDRQISLYTTGVGGGAGGMGTNLPTSPRAYTSWSQSSEAICSAFFRRWSPASFFIPCLPFGLLGVTLGSWRQRLAHILISNRDISFSQSYFWPTLS